MHACDINSMTKCSYISCSQCCLLFLKNIFGDVQNGVHLNMTDLLLNIALK